MELGHYYLFIAIGQKFRFFIFDESWAQSPAISSSKVSNSNSTLVLQVLLKKAAGTRIYHASAHEGKAPLHNYLFK